MDAKILEEIGFEENESNIYIALTRLGPSTASAISKETKIERTLVYRTAEKLVEKGMLNFFVENKIKKFRAAKPENLLVELREKEERLKKFIPELKEISKKEKEPVIEIYSGIKGIKSMVRGVIGMKKDYIAFIGEGKNREFGLFFEMIMKLIEKTGVHERILIKEGVDIAKSKNTEIRHLPKEYVYQATTGICGNKVGMILFHEPFFAVSIESKDLADTYRSLFEILWKNAKL